MSEKTLEKMIRKPRIYDKGGFYQSREDPMRCIEEVADYTGFHFFQCQRKRGYGKDDLYCKQHAKRHPAEEGNLGAMEVG